MASIANLVRESSTTTGTGNFTLASAFGGQTFNDAFGTGGSDVFFYFIAHQTAAEWEVGTGSMSTATVLVRDTVIASSNTGSLVNFSAGNKDVVNDIASGNQVQTTGTPADNQVAVFTDANTIEGDANLTWSGASLAITGGSTRLSRVGEATTLNTYYDVDAGQAAYVNFRTGTTDRWRLYKNGDAESGADAGSNLRISRYNDAGVYQANTVLIERATGDITLESDLTIGGDITLGLTQKLILDDDADSYFVSPSDDILDLYLGGAGEMRVTATALSPFTTDGLALGTSALGWSDLFLASGGVINFDSGDVTLTHSANNLALAGANTLNVNRSGGAFELDIVRTDTHGDGQNIGLIDFVGRDDLAATQLYARITGYAAQDANGAEEGQLRFVIADGTGGTNIYALLNSDAFHCSSDDRIGLGTSSVGWSDLFLASGGVINFNNGNATITHSADQMDVGLNASGSSLNIQRATTELTSVTGASVTATNLIPDGAVVVGVATRITTALGTSNGTTSYEVGDGTDTNRWGDSGAVTGGTTTDNTDWTTTTIQAFTAANNVVLTAVGGNFDGTGAVRIAVYYFDMTAPTS